MTAILVSLNRWWWSRTARERQMLAVMLVLLVGVAAWLLVIKPAWAWREDAAMRHADARSGAAHVQSGLARLGTEAKGGEATARADIAPLVESSAQAAGLSITTGMDAAGGLSFRAEKATSAQLFGWLAGLKADHGLDVDHLAVIENADATLSAEGGFAQGG
jgi:general secretion pathway protein M